MVELWKRIVHKRSRDLSERARASALTHTDFYSLIFFQTTPNVPRIWMDTTSTYPYHKTRIHFLSSDGKILAVQFDYFFVFCLASLLFDPLQSVIPFCSRTISQFRFSSLS